MSGGLRACGPVELDRVGELVRLREVEVEVLALNEGLALRGRGEAAFGGVASRVAAGGQREVIPGLGAGEEPAGVDTDDGSCTGVDTRSCSGFVTKVLCGETE